MVSSHIKGDSKMNNTISTDLTGATRRHEKNGRPSRYRRDFLNMVLEYDVFHFIIKIQTDTQKVCPVIFKMFLTW